VGVGLSTAPGTALSLGDIGIDVVEACSTPRTAAATAALSNDG
jgi:hypothetical protein